MQKLLALLGAKNKEEFVELFKQFIKFGLVGVSNTAVSMAVYYIFLWISPGCCRQSKKMASPGARLS